MDQEELNRRRQIVFSTGYQAGRRDAYASMKRLDEMKFKRGPVYNHNMVQKLLAIKDEINRLELYEIFIKLGYSRDKYNMQMARQLTPILLAAGFERGRRKIAGKSTWVWQFKEFEDIPVPSYEDHIKGF